MFWILNDFTKILFQIVLIIVQNTGSLRLVRKELINRIKVDSILDLGHIF